MEELIHTPLQTYFAKVNLTKVFPEIFTLLWYSQLPCLPTPGISQEGLLSLCSWQGLQVDCREIFDTVPTDSGMCCAFNMDTSALRDSPYKQLIEDMKTEAKEKKVFDVKAGKKNGLTVMLDNHYNKVTFGSVFDDSQGLQVFVGEQEEFPMMTVGGKMLAPGQEHFLQISGYIVEADTDLKTRLSSAERKCFFKDESQLEYFTKYTFNTCMFECGIKHVEESVGCVPWFFPQGKELSYLHLFNPTIFR